MSISWSLPYALLLLLVVPLYPLLVGRGRARIPLPRLEAMKPRSSLIARLPDLFRICVLALLVVALAGPSTAGATREEAAEGIPIVLVVDISSSMLARDFPPEDRLTVAKSAISGFVAERENDPIGLVAFAGEALTLVPPTTHRPILQNAIAGLEVGLLEDGTAIGDGLAAAVNRLREYEGEDAVIALLSDGESNRGSVDPLGAGAAAAALGIRVHTIGVGSEGVASAPVGSAPAGFEYAEQPVGLDEELLRAIASQTGGNYYRAGEPDALERIYGEIDELVPSAIEARTFTETVPWAPLLLLMAAAFLASEWMLRASRWGVVP